MKVSERDVTMFFVALEFNKNYVWHCVLVDIKD